ncbi:MAG: hypothetical protein P1U57_04970, partial [Oleibacter sp.]|nr:hypothetical protein [Thalassolituus sp.]
MPHLRRSFFLGLYVLYAGHAAAIEVTTTTYTAGDNLCSFQEAIEATNSNLTSGDCPGSDFTSISFSEDLFQLVESDSAETSIWALNLQITNRPITVSEDLTIALPEPSVVESAGDGIKYDHQINVELGSATKNIPLFSLASNSTFSLTGWVIDGTDTTDATIISLGNNTNLSLNSVIIENFANESSSLINSDGLIHSSEFFPSGTITIKDSVFRNNQTSGDGAVLNLDTALLDIQNSLFSTNIAAFGDGGAIAVSGNTRTEIRQSFFYSNGAKNGGAIANKESTSELLIENSNFIFNLSSDHGGGISTVGPVVLYSSTFLSNIADTDAANINNPGGGIFIDNAVTQTEIYNTLFYANQNIASDSSDCSGPISVIEYSMITENDECAFPSLTNNVVTDVNNIPFDLVANKQQEFTSYRTRSSKILDLGNPNGCIGIDGPLISDINSNARGINSENGAEGICDIGSTEFKPLTVIISSDEDVYDATFGTGLANQNEVSVSLTIENFGEVALSDLNIFFITPFGYAVIVDGSQVTGIISLANDFSLDAGE